MMEKVENSQTRASISSQIDHRSGNESKIPADRKSDFGRQIVVNAQSSAIFTAAERKIPSPLQRPLSSTFPKKRRRKTSMVFTNATDIPQIVDNVEALLSFSTATEERKPEPPSLSPKKRRRKTSAVCSNVNADDTVRLIVDNLEPSPISTATKENFLSTSTFFEKPKTSAVSAIGKEKFRTNFEPEKNNIDSNKKNEISTKGKVSASDNAKEKTTLENKGMDELTFWSDDQLENIEIYDCCKNHYLLSDDKAMMVLHMILQALKFGDGIDSLDQWLITTCLYATRSRDDFSKPLYIFDETCYPKTNFVQAPAELDFISKIRINDEKAQELINFYKWLNGTFARSGHGIKAAYIGFMVGVLLRSAVKKPSTVLNHMKSKMNQNFASLYGLSYLPSPILPLTDTDLALIQSKMAPPCLWTNTLAFYSIGSHKYYSSVVGDATHQFRVFEAMHNLHFKYCRLGLIPLSLQVIREYSNSYEKFHHALNCVDVEQSLDLLETFLAAYRPENEEFPIDMKYEGKIQIPERLIKNPGIYWPYCRIFDPNYFNELDSVNHPFLKMLLLALISKDENFLQSRQRSPIVDFKRLKNILDEIKLRRAKEVEECLRNFMDLLRRQEWKTLHFFDDSKNVQNKSPIPETTSLENQRPETSRDT